MKAREAEEAEENHHRSRIEKRLAALANKKDRYLDWTLNGIVTEADLSARMADIRRKYSELDDELSRLPVGNNDRIHPTAIKAFADRLTGSLTKRTIALNMLDNGARLSRLIRELIAKILVGQDNTGRLHLTFVGWLQPFIEDQGLPQSAKR